MLWLDSASNLLWPHVWAVVPVALVAWLVCRALPCRPVTRHAAWVIVLAWFLLPLLLPAPPAPAWVTTRSDESTQAGPIDCSSPAPTVVLLHDGSIPGAAAADDPTAATVSFAATVPATATERASAQGASIATTDSQSRAPVATRPLRLAAPTERGTAHLLPGPAGSAGQRAFSSQPGPTPPTALETSSAPRPEPTHASPAAPAARPHPAPQAASSDPVALGAGAADSTADATPPSAAVPSNPVAGAPGLNGVVDFGRDVGRAWLAALLRVRDALALLPTLPAEIWFSGAALLLAWRMLRIAAFAHRLRGGRTADLVVRREIQQVAERLGIARVPRVTLVDANISPLIWCGWRPTLVLPIRLWTQLDANGRKAILCHELAHLRRRDHWLVWLELLVTTLYWWHPLAWWARRRISEEADTCCDAWVTWLMPRSRRAYAEALLKTRNFIDTRSAATPMPSMAVASPGFKRFARRLTMVMTHNSRPRPSWTTAAIACTLGLTAWVATPALSCPPKDTPAPAEHPSQEKAPSLFTNAMEKLSDLFSGFTADEQPPVALFNVRPPEDGEAQPAPPPAPAEAHRMRTRVPRPASLMPATPAPPGNLPARARVGVFSPAPMPAGPGPGAGPAARALAPLAGVPGGTAYTFGPGGAVAWSGPPGGAAPTPRAFSATTPMVWTEAGEETVQRYQLPDGKRDALFELMVRDDVPIRVSRDGDSIVVHAPPRQQEAVRAFIMMINSGPQEEQSRAYRIPRGKLEQVSQLMIRDDVPIRVSPGDDALTVIGTPMQHDVFRAFLDAIGVGGQDGQRPRRPRAEGGQRSRTENRRDGQTTPVPPVPPVPPQPPQPPQPPRAPAPPAPPAERVERMRRAESAQRRVSETRRDSVRSRAEALRRQAEELQRKAEELERQADQLDAQAEALRERSDAGNVGDSVREALRRELRQVEKQMKTLRKQSEKMQRSSDTLSDQADELAEAAEGDDETHDADDEDDEDAPAAVSFDAAALALHELARIDVQPHLAAIEAAVPVELLSLVAVRDAHANAAQALATLREKLEPELRQALASRLHAAHEAISAEQLERIVTEALAQASKQVERACHEIEAAAPKHECGATSPPKP